VHISFATFYGHADAEERFLLDFFIGSMSVTTKDKDPDTPSLQG